MGGYDKKGSRMKAKKAPTTKTLAERIHKLEKAPELKFHDSQFGPTGLTGVGIAWTSICLVPQGDDVEQRSGNKITSKYVSIRATFQGVNTALGDSFVRCIVFWDSAPNGVNPVIVDNNVNTMALLDSNAGVVPGFYANRNLRTGKRYKILEDTVHKLEPHCVQLFTVATGNTTQVIPPYAYYQKYVRLGRAISYSGVGAVISDLTQNGLFVAFLQSSTSGFCNIYGSSRMSYTDE